MSTVWSPRRRAASPTSSRPAATSSASPPRPTTAAAPCPGPSASSPGPATSSQSGGTSPSRTASPVSAAAEAVGQAITTASSHSGRGRTLKVASTITPSVPSAPTWSFGRSYPATFLTTRPPPATSAPSAPTTRMPIRRSRARPCEARSGPARLAARTPPTVVASGRGGSSGSHCPERASVSATRASGQPASRVTVMSCAWWSRTRARRSRRTSTSRRRGGAPTSRCAPRPLAMSANPPAAAARTQLCTSATLPGRTTQPGTIPSTASSGPPGRAWAPPTTSVHALTAPPAGAARASRRRPSRRGRSCGDWRGPPGRTRRGAASSRGGRRDRRGAGPGRSSPPRSRARP